MKARDLRRPKTPSLGKHASPSHRKRSPTPRLLDPTALPPWSDLNALSPAVFSPPPSRDDELHCALGPRSLSPGHDPPRRFRDADEGRASLSPTLLNRLLQLIYDARAHHVSARSSRGFGLFGLNPEGPKPLFPPPIHLGPCGQLETAYEPRDLSPKLRERALARRSWKRPLACAADRG